MKHQARRYKKNVKLSSAAFLLGALRVGSLRVKYPVQAFYYSAH